MKGIIGASITGSNDVLVSLQKTEYIFSIDYSLTQEEAKEFHRILGAVIGFIPAQDICPHCSTSELLCGHPRHCTSEQNPENQEPDDEFDDKYEGDPSFNWDNQEGQEGMMENFGEHYQRVYEKFKLDPLKVWTIYDHEDERTHIKPGMHTGDSFMYFISLESWESEEEDYVWG